MPSRVLIINPDALDQATDFTVRLSDAHYEVVTIAALQREEHYTADLALLCASDVDAAAAGCGAVRRHPSLRDLPLLLMIPQKIAARIDPTTGMDDVLLSPASLDELLLRVAMALWRKDRVNSSNILKIGDLAVDMTNYVVRLRGQILDMTLKEYELLSYLAGNPGRVFTRAVLLNNVWGYEYFGGTRTVDVHIRRLRAKLGDWNEDMIQTVRGVGYRFSAEYGR